MQRVVDYVANITNGISGGTPKTLVSGDNQFTIPAGTNYIIIILPTGNTIATGFSWTAADTTHRYLQPAGCMVIPIMITGTPPTSFYLNTAADHSSATNVVFI